MFIDYSQFEENLREVRARIDSACSKAGRDSGSVQLLPVTKNHPADAAEYVWRSGLRAVGENRVQEALEKIDLAEPALQWDLIGPLQSNKAKRVVERFARVQTVDRLKIANALQRFAEEQGKTMRILMQVNAGSDPNKSGTDLSEAPWLLDSILAMPHLALEGLMTIAPLDDDLSVAQRCFAALRECRDRLEARGGIALPELSMGMSGDIEQAIAEGSTLVRVGTALFGART